jgi:hypothetical protein
MRSLSLIAALGTMLGCEADGDVRVLELPPLERPTPEARLGLPEIAGSWRFAGWEIVRGDSTSLERTFPSFGELELSTQRLDSIAGTFRLAGGQAAVVGEVRKSGDVALVTLAGGAPDRFIAGRYLQDTLWLELTSIMPAEEWPQEARAAFVRGAPEAPIAWLRGARPGDAAPEAVPDSLEAMTDSIVGPPAAVTPGTGTPTPGGPSGAPPPAARPSAQPPAAAPSGRPQPIPTAPPSPSPVAPAPAAPPPAAQPTPPEPDPEPEPEPEPEPAPRAPPRLLGDPVSPQ